MLNRCYGRCGSDKIWQTVPDTCSGDRKARSSQNTLVQNRT